MSEKKIYDLVNQANKRISRINQDFIPVTLKSVADMYSNIIWEKGTRRQGQIKNFYEAKIDIDDKQGIFDYDMYKQQVQDMLNEEWFRQTYYNENVNYQYEKVSYMLEEIQEQYPDLDIDVSKISKKNFLKAVEIAGEQVNSLKRAYGNSYKDYQFYDLLVEALESYAD